jgi:hypothetical protein
LLTGALKPPDVCSDLEAPLVCLGTLKVTGAPAIAPFMLEALTSMLFTPFLKWIPFDLIIGILKKYFNPAMNNRLLLRIEVN